MEKPRDGVDRINIVELGMHTLFEFDQEVDPGAEKIQVAIDVKRDTKKPKTLKTGTFKAIIGNRLSAEIVGFIKKNKKDGLVEFRTFSSSNLTRRLERKPFVPRLVGRTIAELVSRGFVERWYSDYIKSPVLHRGLTEGGKSMYEKYLSADPRLVVTAPCLRTRFRYLVTAKPQVK